MEEPDEAGILDLPYVEEESNGRTNRGFVDLRGLPELAVKVEEAKNSPALQLLLGTLAQTGSVAFSVGCDRGAIPERNAQGRFEAGGYVQLVLTDAARALRKDHAVMIAGQLGAYLKSKVGSHLWAVQTILTVVGLKKLGGPPQVWSLAIQFYGFASEKAEAWHSSEELLQAISRFFAEAAPPLNSEARI